MPQAPRQSTEAEIDALEQLCVRLAGFGTDASLEWVDGYLSALVASRRAIVPSEWLPAMWGDAFERAFADPGDVQQAMSALLARWNVLANQLDPEALLDGYEDLRLAPLMLTYDDAARAEVVAAGHMNEAEALDQLQTGALWADGFFAAVEAFPDDWPEPDVDTEEGRWYDDCRTRVAALMLPQSDLAEYLASEYPGESPEREQLIDDACFAVQDLRVYWLDHAPRPEQRRVGPQPGRNDPCPCGSGKKFKKCHGNA
jgi:uncharacterized protein